MCVFDVLWYMFTVIITAQHCRESFKYRCRAYIPIGPAEISPVMTTSPSSSMCI